MLVNEREQELSVDEILSAIRRNISHIDVKKVDDVPSKEEMEIIDLEEEVFDDVDGQNLENKDECPCDDEKDFNDVISDQCSDSVINSLNKFANISINEQKLSQEEKIFTQQNSLDGVVKQALKDWMDSNLPEMVERIVEREISLITDQYKK